MYSYTLRLRGGDEFQAFLVVKLKIMIFSCYSYKCFRGDTLDQHWWRWVEFESRHSPGSWIRLDTGAARVGRGVFTSAASGGKEKKMRMIKLEVPSLRRWSMTVVRITCCGSNKWRWYFMLPDLASYWRSVSRCGGWWLPTNARTGCGHRDALFTIERHQIVDWPCWLSIVVWGIAIEISS